MIAALLAVALVAAPVPVEKPKPNPLTPKEIADGWIMLFDGETTFGWKIDGVADVKDGTLVLGKGKNTTATLTTDFGNEFEFRMEWSGRGIIQTADKAHGFIPRTKDGWGIIEVGRTKEDGRYLKLSGGDAFNDEDVPKDKLSGSPLRIKTVGSQAVLIRSVKLRPLNTKPLFNGKNLDGWKVTQTDPKRVATKFEITKDGELSAKNGPGDMQTEKQFDDFVLQIECKTNGKALNSGIFFRCIPDQYQNGYEAQIQNAWLLDRTKPIDYGTGAIYRRIAARKVVSDDNEWFTLTLAARGAHIATWVNGYQTVDWTDERKANDNPRQGLRTAKGHLSIQGHDVTTDLLFRNIRIAELPK